MAEAQNMNLLSRPKAVTEELYAKPQWCDD
jgi:hypothetical protein